MELHATDSTIQRFWSRVAITANPDKCWEWLGSKHKTGYGSFTTTNYKVNRKKNVMKAHRMAYLVTHDMTNTPLVVCHSCDNRGCVNPNHLWLGTSLDNTMDMVKKGRHRGAPGEANAKAKITQEQVTEMRNAYANGERQFSLVKRFGLKKAQVSCIVNGKSWHPTKPHEQ